MTVRHESPLEVGRLLTTQPTVSASQIADYFAGYRADADARLGVIVAAAPPVAEAVLVETCWNLAVSGDPSEWEIEFDLVAVADVADHVSEAAACGYLAGFHDQAKGYIRGVVANVPRRYKATITRWHIHRDGRGGDEAP